MLLVHSSSSRPFIGKRGSSVCFVHVCFTFILTTMATYEEPRVEFYQFCDEFAKYSSAAAHGINMSQLGYLLSLKYPEVTTRVCIGANGSKCRWSTHVQGRPFEVTGDAIRCQICLANVNDDWDFWQLCAQLSEWANLKFVEWN